MNSAAISVYKIIVKLLIKLKLSLGPCIILNKTFHHYGLGKGPKKTTKVWTYVQTLGRQGISDPYFFQKKKVWTKSFEVGRSAMVVHTFKNL